MKRNMTIAIWALFALLDSMLAIFLCDNRVPINTAVVITLSLVFIIDGIVIIHAVVHSSNANLIDNKKEE